jgi:membrane protein
MLENSLQETEMMNAASLKQFIIDLYRKMNNDNIYNGAAALGFYLTLSIFPALILLTTIIPYLPIRGLNEALMGLLMEAIPAQSVGMVAGVVNEVTSQRRGGLLSLGLLGTLWAASSGMYAIMQQLDITYDVKEGRSFVRTRATAVALSLLFGLLVIGAFSLIVLGDVIQVRIGARLGFSSPLLASFAVFRWLVIVLALMLGFATIYYYGPDVEQDFRFITPGSVLGVLLLIAASLGFALYINNFSDYSATYGSIGAVIVLMLWLYIIGFVILLGSEINSLFERYSPRGGCRGEQKGGGG